MNYDVDIVKKENYKISNWSGGKTTELFIYPKSAKYNERNFDWRISAATVEAEMSVFTNLPEIKREIVIIEGKTTLQHKDKYKVTLNPFDKDSFMGDWETTSYGKASDFNLMTSKVCSGNLDVIDFDCENKIELEINKHEEKGNKIMECFYSIGGSLQYVLENNKYYVDEKDLLCICYLSSEKCDNIEVFKETKNNIKIIRATVFY